MISYSRLGDNWLGNQLFQMAATIALALRNNDKYVFPAWKYEKYFTLKDCFSSELKIDLSEHDTYRDPNFYFFEPIPYRKNLNLWGYFQSEKYFKDFEDTIKILLMPKNVDEIKYNHTAIHVRRGDYLNYPKEYNILDMSYYSKAMNILNSKFYTIFSNDIEWCKSNFVGNNFEFSEGKTDIEDLTLMISYEHHIIANSAYSWWGAYLNKNPFKKIIAPKQWWSIDNLKSNSDDLIPKEWMQI